MKVFFPFIIKMEKTNTTKAIASIILMGVLIFSAMSLASAKTMYSGETIYGDLQDEIQNLKSFECNLTAENYGLEGTNFTTNETGYILIVDLDFKPDNLTISCLLNGEKFVQESKGIYRGSPKKQTTVVEVNETINETEIIEDVPEEVTEEKNKGLSKGEIAIIIVLGLFVVLMIYLYVRGRIENKLVEGGEE